MKSIKQETIELILSEKADEAFWFFELGRSSSTENMDDSENQFMNSFFDNGKKVWEGFQEKIKSVLCDVNTHQPKEFVKELTEGDLKDLVANIITLFLASYSMTLAIAIPLTALVMKRGVNNICL